MIGGDSIGDVLSGETHTHRAGRWITSRCRPLVDTFHRLPSRALSVDVLTPVSRCFSREKRCVCYTGSAPSSAPATATATHFLLPSDV